MDFSSQLLLTYRSDGVFTERQAWLEKDFYLLDLNTVTRRDLPARLDWSIIGWTILLRAFMNLVKTKK